MNPKLRRCRRTPKLFEKTKSRHYFCHAEVTGWRRDLFPRREFPRRPEPPCARRSKAANGVRAGLLAFASPLSEATIFTVARPRGILTRFPILPARRGTPKR